MIRGKKMKNSVINVRVSEQIKKELERCALKEKRTLSNLVEKVLCDHLQKEQEAATKLVTVSGSKAPSN